MSLILFLSLKFYQICWCMIKTFAGLPRKSSVLFYNLGNLRLSSEIFNFGNLREVVANLRKVVKNAVFFSHIFFHLAPGEGLYCKPKYRAILYKIILSIYYVLFNFGHIRRWDECAVHILYLKTLLSSMRSLVRYCTCSWHSNIKFISSRHRVISSIYFMRLTCVTHQSNLSKYEFSKSKYFFS